jgi:hypothetical protein
MNSESHLPHTLNSYCPLQCAASFILVPRDLQACSPAGLCAQRCRENPGPLLSSAVALDLDRTVLVELGVERDWLLVVSVDLCWSLW